MALQPVVKRSVSADVFEQIADDMLSGELAPGTALPSERQLAERLGVSRPAVREALQRLSAAGLVAVRQGDATTVLDYRRGAGLEVLPRLLVRAGALDPAVARSILEARLHNGPKVAELAAVRVAATRGEMRVSAAESGPAHSPRSMPDSGPAAAPESPSAQPATSTTTPGSAATAENAYRPDLAWPAATTKLSDVGLDGGSAETPTELAETLSHLVDSIAGAEADPIAQQRIALEFWDHIVDAADSIVFRLMNNMLRAAYEPALAALAPIMSAEVGNVAGYRELADAIVAGKPQEAAERARALLEPATTALISVLDGHRALLRESS
ncbi:FadR/GntR family transcriptional regulator [Nocardia cyriacigeorgica]|uniref:Fatty acid metabolism regulator protein n=1 Tax=Nocardia cyriacigeorgica TaxID=135487 RepID=A0A4V6ICR7_9NOCA|nr:GntR family transcriptional regulator [Nocardia cyriacigeorgica]VFB00644.1 Fatty acid metabolism regulator protein [Nocardia cyriacigeorgica]